MGGSFVRVRGGAWGKEEGTTCGCEGRGCGGCGRAVCNRERGRQQCGIDRAGLGAGLGSVCTDPRGAYRALAVCDYGPHVVTGTPILIVVKPNPVHVVLLVVGSPAANSSLVANQMLRNNPGEHLATRCILQAWSQPNQRCGKPPDQRRHHRHCFPIPAPTHTNTACTQEHARRRDGPGPAAVAAAATAVRAYYLLQARMLLTAWGALARLSACMAGARGGGGGGAAYVPLPLPHAVVVAGGAASAGGAGGDDAPRFEATPSAAPTQLQLLHAAGVGNVPAGNGGGGGGGS
eukprot:17226-Chlamydomonas_euryale.AAC.1